LVPFHGLCHNSIKNGNWNVFCVLDPEKCKEIGKIGHILFGGARTEKNLGKMTKKGRQKFINFSKKIYNFLVVREPRQNLSSGPRVGKG